MKILFSPQVNENDIKIEYKFKGEIIIVTFDDTTDTFDFSEFSTDGELDRNDIETILSINPIISAKRENGILSVQLLNFIHEDATYEDKFPEWIEV